MDTTTVITIESILLSVLVALLGVVCWSIKRYIDRDDRWKDAMTAEMVRQGEKIAAFTVQLASKKDVDELYGITRKQGERLSSVEARQKAHEAYHENCG